MNFSGSKKGFIGAISTIIASIFILGILTVIGYAIFDGFSTEISGSSMPELNNSAVSTSLDGFTRGMNMFDGIISLLVFAAILSVGVLAYNYTPSKVFVVLIWVYGLFLGFLAYILAYTFNRFIQEGALASTITHFPITIALLTNLHWIALTMVIVGSVMAYRSSSANTGGTTL